MVKDGRTIGGRPLTDDGETIDLRLDAKVFEFFRPDEPGWQSRVNAALRQFMRKMN